LSFNNCQITETDLGIYFCPFYTLAILINASTSLFRWYISVIIILVTKPIHFWVLMPR